MVTCNGCGELIRPGTSQCLSCYVAPLIVVIDELQATLQGVIDQLDAIGIPELDCSPDPCEGRPPYYILRPSGKKVGADGSWSPMAEEEE